MAFVIGGIAGLVSAIAASVFLGFGLLAAFGIYMLVSTTLPLAVLMREAGKDPMGGELAAVAA
ncbi:hypothetical protein [Mesobacterium pallidum]|uniref:hypothetical protein n=1 Tax=Mesobacterium pallidum TaxID=2872037 RepID=UPI001EE2182A|nr:hypothetical protein [Mesobacterium pallidum]